MAFWNSFSSMEVYIMTKEEQYRLEDLRFTNYENLREIYTEFIYSVLSNDGLSRVEKDKVTFENMVTIKGMSQ